jgi:inner membrane transporter RhtA
VESAAVPRGLLGLHRVPPMGLVVTATTSSQFGAALAATLFDDLGAAGTAVLRLTLAALVLTLVVRPSWRARDAATLRVVVAFGLVLGGMNLCFYEALARIPLGVAVTIEFAGPLGVAVVLSRTRLDLVWAALAAAGIFLLSDPVGGSVDGAGLAFILGSAACWAGYILIAQRALRAVAGADALALAMIVAALVPLGPGIAQAGTDLLHPAWLAAGLGVALLSSVLPYTLEAESLRRLPPHVFGVLMSLEPAVAALAGFLVLGQSLRARDLVAIALVIGASVGVSRRGSTAAPNL